MFANKANADGLEALGDMYMILGLGIVFLISIIILFFSLFITFNNRSLEEVKRDVFIVTFSSKTKTQSNNFL